MQIHILTIRDHSDFGAVRHESAHADENAAWEFSRDIALPAVQSITDEEWHRSLEASVRTMEYFA